MTVRRFARPLLGLTTAIAVALLLPSPAETGEAQKSEVKPIRALLITGGGYHDYKSQKALLPEGVSARANVEWTVIYDESTKNDHKVPLFETDDWADGYDVVVHNDCYADVADPAFIAKVIAPHKNGTPAIVVHCAMHTFRSMKTDDWREFLGVSTYNHGRQHPLDVKNMSPDHPIMKGYPASWVTGNEELYAIKKV